MKNTRITRKWSYDIQQYKYFVHFAPGEGGEYSATAEELNKHEEIGSEKMKRIILEAVKYRTELLLENGRYGERQSRRFRIWSSCEWGGYFAWVLIPKTKKQMERDIEMLQKLCQTFRD